MGVGNSNWCNLLASNYKDPRATRVTEWVCADYCRFFKKIVWLRKCREFVRWQRVYVVHNGLLLLLLPTEEGEGMASSCPSQCFTHAEFRTSGMDQICFEEGWLKILLLSLTPFYTLFLTPPCLILLHASVSYKLNTWIVFVSLVLHELMAVWF